jgi:hypothetical protein
MPGFTYGDGAGATYGEDTGSVYATPLPRQVENPQAEASTDPLNAIDLTWDTAGSADEYVIYRALTSGTTEGDYTQLAVTASTSYLDENLDETKTYFYRVAGRNDVGDGELSAEASASPLTEGTTTATADTQTSVSVVTTSAGEAITTASATSTATTVVPDATYNDQRVKWRVTRDGTDVEDSVFDVDPVVDTANPFGDYAVIKIDDTAGNKFDQYARGTRVDVAVSTNAGISFTDRFTGYVVERRENEQAGADVLEVEAYSFDQFLRRNTVTNDQRGNTITQALADIIQTDTPVTYVAGNVDVGDDQELTRSYQGETVESTLRDLAFKSNNEDFGVNDDLGFFFRERETVHIDRGIDNTQWFNYDIPELGKETINEVEVWFDDGEESVVVDDGTDKLDLQDNLGLPSPGTQRAELNRPLLTDIADAEDVGRKYLAFRNATLSGTVTTFGLFTAEPGDTIDIEIASRGIDEEFVIAATEYRWGRDETILTIVEKRGDVDDILSELNDSVQRQEMEGANRDAPKNRITTTNATGVVAVDVDADGNTPDGDRLVNDGRRGIRDTWTGDAAPDITTLVVGNDGTGLSRSNTSLRSQTNSATVSQTLPGTKSVEFTASITQTGVQEVGLETADGRLITRAVFADPVDLAGDVTVTLTVSNDASVSRGVLTNDGQTAVRDVLADNSPTLPNAYAYGDDGTAVSEADTALGNELVDVSLDEILIQDASLSADWASIVDGLGDTDPLTTTNDELALAQIADTREGDDFDTQSGSTAVNGGVYSGGGARVVDTFGATITWEYTPEYTIPAGEFDIAVRDDDGGAGDGSEGVAAFEWRFNGERIEGLDSTGANLNLGWSFLSTQEYDGPTWNPPELEAGTTYTIELECTDGGDPSDQYAVDVIAPYDSRYETDLDFDNTNDGSGGYLDGPELYPSLVDVTFNTATTRRNITEARFASAWNDTSGLQYVELANDGSTFTRFNNADSGTATFASPEQGVDTNIGLSRYGSRTTATPQQGFNGQAIQDWDLFANPDAVFTDNIGETLTRAVIAPNTITGETVREAGLKSDSTLLTRHEVAEFDVLSGQRISSAETTGFKGED